MLIESRQATLLIEFASRKKLLFSKEKFFFQLFNLMKRRRLRAFLLLASSVLMSILSLFWYCLFSFSSFSFSWSLSLFVSFSVSLSSSARDWINSMNSKRCLWIHLIWHHRLHLNTFELRELSQRWIFKRSFSRSWSNFFHLHINMIIHLHISMILHLQISMKILHVLRQSSSIFCSRRTISWSYHF